MIDQQKFHHVALRRQCALRFGEDLHAFHHRRRARRLRLRYRLAADLGFDHAHAAVRRDRQLLVIAEARDRDAGLVGSSDDHRVLRHLHGLAVDFDVDEIRSRGRRCSRGRLRTHAATPCSSLLPWPCRGRGLGEGVLAKSSKSAPSPQPSPPTMKPLGERELKVPAVIALMLRLRRSD